MKKLNTEDPVLFVSWIMLSGAGMWSCGKYIPMHKGTRSVILSNIIRLASWIVLSMTAAPRPFFYHWCMPPVVAMTALLIILNAVVP